MAQQIQCIYCGHSKSKHGKDGYASQGFGPIDVIEEVCFVGRGKKDEWCECPGWKSPSLTQLERGI